MIHEQDFESLTRILGIDLFPESLEAEYAIRIRMYHANGHSGPLGTIALIDMVRQLGLLAPRDWRPEPAPIINWREYPQDGSTRIEARYSGQWMPGVFLGFVDNGILAIRLDQDDYVRECYRDVVRLEAVDAPFAAVAEPVSAPTVEETQEVDETEDESELEPEV